MSKDDRTGCRGCRFSVPLYIGDGDELMNCCVYILRTGKKRPCMPGAGCTVYEPIRTDKYTAVPGEEWRKSIDMHWI